MADSQTGVVAGCGGDGCRPCPRRAACDAHALGSPGHLSARTRGAAAEPWGSSGGIAHCEQHSGLPRRPRRSGRSASNRVKRRHSRMADTLTIALIRDVFFSDLGEQRLRARLAEVRALGAKLALLPELPLNPWSPATTTARDDDAEPPDGVRSRVLAAAAAEAGIGVVGGAIVRDPASGTRHNTALVFDGAGTLVARYRKVHLPDEDGFHEPCHYDPGDRAAELIDAFALPIGLQICSDINRPEGSHL